MFHRDASPSVCNLGLECHWHQSLFHSWRHNRRVYLDRAVAQRCNQRGRRRWGNRLFSAVYRCGSSGFYGADSGLRTHLADHTLGISQKTDIGHCGGAQRAACHTSAGECGHCSAMRLFARARPRANSLLAGGRGSAFRGCRRYGFERNGPSRPTTTAPHHHLAAGSHRN